jgi:hypothetical protein
MCVGASLHQVALCDLLVEERVEAAFAGATWVDLAHKRGVSQVLRQKRGFSPLACGRSHYMPSRSELPWRDDDEALEELASTEIEPGEEDEIVPAPPPADDESLDTMH